MAFKTAGYLSSLMASVLAFLLILSIASQPAQKQRANQQK